MPTYAEWQQETIQAQQKFAGLLGDRTWDSFKFNQKSELFKKIAYVVFGPPKDINDNAAYTSEQRKKVDDLVEKCDKYARKISDATSICIAVFFVCGRKDSSTFGTFPIIRVKWKTGTCITDSYFIDHFGRVYNRWRDFLRDNELSGWWICAPEDGKYELDCNGQVKLKWHDQTERGKVLQVGDIASTATGVVTSIGMTAGLVMSFFPPTAPFGLSIVAASSIVGAPAAAYGTGRSVCKLIDRGTHDQSISLADPEARACWITTAASALSIGTMAAAKGLSVGAKAGADVVMNKGTRVLVNTLGITSLSLNGVGIVNSMVEIAKKDEVTPLDVLQLTTSVFFFTHSVVNFKTAGSLIKDAQREHLNDSRQQLTPEQRKVFDSMLEAKQKMVKPGTTKEMRGNHEFIRELKQIENPKEFFSHFKIQPTTGHLNIHDALVIDSKAFLQMTHEQRDRIVQQSQQLQRGDLTPAQFDKSLAGIRKEFRISFEHQRADAAAKVKSAFGVSDIGQIEVNGKRIFDNMKPHELDRLNLVMKQTGKNYDPQRVELAKKMAAETNCKNVAEFTAVTEYFVRKMDAEVSAKRAQNPNPARPQGVKAEDYYFEQSAKELLSNPAKRSQMIKEFQDLNARCDAANKAGQPRFGNPYAATNHYDKHPYFPKVDPRNNLMPKRYFQIAREMTGGKMENPIWTQDGSTLTCKFRSEKYGAVAVRFDNLANGTQVIATLMAEDGSTAGDPLLVSD